MRKIGHLMNAIAAVKSSGPRVRMVRPRVLVGVLAVLAATATLVTSTALPARSIATASASAGPCPAVQVVFARGTGETPGLGRVGAAFVDSLRSLVPGKSVAAYAVDYPATRDFARAIDGANDAGGFISKSVAACPDTKLVLGGYSQGAAIIDLITAPSQAFFGFARPLPADISSHVGAVAVFGNPSNRIGGGPLTAISPLYGDKTIDLCNGADPVCSNGNDVPAHSLYVESGMASQAAQFVAQRLSAQIPAPNAVSLTAGTAGTAGGPGTNAPAQPTPDGEPVTPS
jgi:cutinase